MFVVQAHSFVQQARLAITLAWVAGYTNILAFLTCGHAVSHVSGTSSELGRLAVTPGGFAVAVFSLFLLTAFVTGAAISGFATEYGRRCAWESIYVIPMAIEAVLLAAFAAGVELHAQGTIETGLPLYLMAGLASLAMGVQNATITRISSGVVRTTHVTGVLTDLGLEAAQMVYWLRDRRRNIPPGDARGLLRSVRTHPTARRLALLASIIGSFVLGSALGTLAYIHAPPWSMFPPVIFLIWIIYQDLAHPIAEIEPSTLEQFGGGDRPDAEGQSAEPLFDRRLAVYHVRRPESRKGRTHRMPNLLAWADRLPEHVRVVILDLAEVDRIDANSAIELCELVDRSRRQGRDLVIAGITPEQFEQLRSTATGSNSSALSPMNACSDLELAIARGLNVLRSHTSSAHIDTARAAAHRS
ncbi:MAG: DUF1275 family protein [Phycisphaeraceae bacterium]|nr:DUF1275 family protein [Phycisphaeraceae bacterium]